MTNEKDKELAHAVLMSGSSRYVDPTLEDEIAKALATVRAEEREAAWQPIETADPEIPALLFTPARRLWNDPTDKPIDIRVAKPRDWTWATHWQPLPDTAALEALTEK